VRREADLLAADRFATTLGIRLVAAETDRVEVEMTIGPAHLDEAGGLRPEIAFALADCAMSLISNQSHPAFAVAAHLVGTGSVNPSATVRAVAMPSHQSPSATTWRVDVTSGDRHLSSLTGTTLDA
jgi:acyl-coenzyme A thioesterase PaaI-like protein